MKTSLSPFRNGSGRHTLPLIAAEPDVARRQSEIRMPAREEAFALRHEQEVRS